MPAHATVANASRPAPRTAAAIGGWRRAEAVIRDAGKLLADIVVGALAPRPVHGLAGQAPSLPGDELVADPKLQWTHAITLRARPDEIWPWLIQMGCRRAGWYSHDGLDNGGVTSAEGIISELQHVQVGDIFPMTPTADSDFVVRAVQSERVLVLGDASGSATWAFVLEPVSDSETQLIARVRAGYERLALGLMLRILWHPVHFGMQRRQLLNLKRLVERPA